jgi:hypothetical protein
MRILVALLLLAGVARAADWNAAVLAAVREMPVGGGYSATSEASARLRNAADLRGDALVVRPSVARPSYCSGATFLVLLKVVAQAQASGALTLDPAALLPAMQRDGEGVWGRWNANGPGTARLFHELGLGENFTSWDAARPGDFLKIFWRDAVGANERGHSVVYLGTVTRDGVECVRFWSSNKPGGYGEKIVPKAKIARALFSRLEHPERFALAASLPRTDTYLASLLERDSSFAEACRLSGAQ